MVKLAAMILWIGYLAFRMDLELFFVIFTMYCFQKYFIELYTFPKLLEALAQELSGCLCIKWIYFYASYFVV